MTKSSPFRSLFNKTFWISAAFLIIKTLLTQSILILNSIGFRFTLSQMSNFNLTQGVVIICLEMLIVLQLALTVSRFSLLSKAGGVTLLIILLLTDWTYSVFEVNPQVFFYYDFYDYAFHAVSIILFFAAVLALFHDVGKFVVPAVIFISMTVSVSSLFSLVPSLILLSYVSCFSEDNAEIVNGAGGKRFKKLAGASAVAVTAGFAANYLFRRFVYSGNSNGNKLFFLNLLRIYFKETGIALLCCLPVLAFCLFVCLRARDKKNKAVKNRILSLVVLSYAASLAGAFFCSNFWFLTTVSITPLLILMLSCSEKFISNVGAEVADSVERVDGFFRKKPYWLVLVILLMYATATLSVTGNSSIL